MKINDNKIVDGLTPDGSYQDRVDVQGQERAGTGITADIFNQIIREFQDNYIVKAGLIPSSDDLDQFYEATQHFINQSLLPALLSLNNKIASSILNFQEEIFNTRSLRIGEITAWAGPTETIPNNAYLCDDSLLLITDHQALFNAIGHSWKHNRTPPSGYFYLPDGRAGVAKGAGASPSSKYSKIENRGLVGTYQHTAIINITGSSKYGLYGESYTAINSGALKVVSGGKSKASSSGWSGNLKLVLDASLVVPTSTTNRDNNFAVNWIIYYKA